MLEFLKASFLVLHFSCSTLMTFLTQQTNDVISTSIPRRIDVETTFSVSTRDDGICNIAIYAGDATVCSKCDQASGLWQQLELTSELESDLGDTVNCGKK